MTRYVYRHPVKQEPILSRVLINGERVMWLKWPEGSWLAECNAFDGLKLIPDREAA